ncbi:MAG: glutamyl-tRNA reductase [Alphaproteobacteria bacterium]|nr:glutamyl-tRNA reductase [Alphaproteobacteria bacterium]
MGHRPETGAAPADYVVVGASHKTSSAALRDLLFVADSDVPGILDELRTGGFTQALVVSTCDRVEIHGASDEPALAIARAREILSRRAGYEPVDSDGVYDLSGAAAARHMFAVAASLESAVVGEAEVLGQLKAAHALARTHGATGPELELLLQRAYAAAKDIRTNTAIAEGPVSLATAAVQAARNLFGDLKDISALLVGPGEMGLLMLDQFRQSGLRRVTVAASSAARAQALGRTFDAHSVTYDELPATLPGADLVIGAAGLGRPMVTVPMIGEALRARRRKPMFVLDVAIPGDADPEISGLDDAFLFDLDDLETISRSNRNARDAAAREAWQMIERHTQAFETSLAERDVVPTVSDLYAHFEVVRAEVLREAGNADADEVTRRLVNRLLHHPSEALRAAARAGDRDDRTARVVRDMFALDESSNGPDMASDIGSEEE